MRTLTVAIACVFVASQAAATQQLQPRAVPTLESVESFAYQSPSMGERYALNVPLLVTEHISSLHRGAATHRDLAMSIYLRGGMLEASDEVVEGLARVVSGMTHLTGTLAGRHYPSLKVATEVFPGMGHGDVDGATIARGLRTLYPTP